MRLHRLRCFSIVRDKCCCRSWALSPSAALSAAHAGSAVKVQCAEEHLRTQLGLNMTASKSLSLLIALHVWHFLPLLVSHCAVMSSDTIHCPGYRALSCSLMILVRYPAHCLALGLQCAMPCSSMSRATGSRIWIPVDCFREQREAGHTSQMAVLFSQADVVLF